MRYEEIDLRRDTEVVQIPQGITITIPAGTRVVVTQALGDSYTVQAPTLGGLYRINGKDADALGKTPRNTDETAAAVVGSGPVDEGRVWDELKNVFDPEIPVNIVDLGLVYDLKLLPLEAGGTRVEVKMTLTAPGCGMGRAIAMDAQQRLEHLAGVAEAAVELVWDPPWNPQMISPEGRSILGMN